jgi:hypothetical protein
MMTMGVLAQMMAKMMVSQSLWLVLRILRVLLSLYLLNIVLTIYPNIILERAMSELIRTDKLYRHTEGKHQPYIGLFRCLQDEQLLKLKKKRS